MSEQSGFFAERSLDGLGCLRDGDYEQTLERLSTLLPQNRADVLALCRKAFDDGEQAARQDDGMSDWSALLAEQRSLLKAVEQEASDIHWDGGSLFRQALSSDEKRTVCRILTLLEELEQSLKLLCGSLHLTEQALQAELRETDGVLAFLRAVRLVASEDSELVFLCDAAVSRREQLRTQRQLLLARVNGSGALLTPLVRQQLPYACRQILRLAELDDTEHDGNARELLSVLSSLSEAATSVLLRCEERLFDATSRR